MDVKEKNRLMGSSTSTIRFIANLLLRYPFSTGAVILFSVIAACTELLTIALIMPFIESLQGSAGGMLGEKFKMIGFLSPYFKELSLVNKIRAVAALLILVELLKSAFRYVSSAFSVRLSLKISDTIQMGVMDTMLACTKEYLSRYKMATLFTVLNTFTYNTGAIITAITVVVPDVFIAAISLMVLFSISIPMTIMSFVLTLAISISFYSCNSLAKKYSKENVQIRLALNQKGIEILNGMDVIKLFGRSKFINREYSKLVLNLNHLLFKQEKIKAIITPLFNVLLVLTASIIILAATFLLQRSTEYWLSILLLFLVVLSRLGGPLARMNLARTTIVTLFPAVQELHAFLVNAQLEKDTEGCQDFTKLNKEIVFDDVSFRYNASDHEVLKKVNFSIYKNKMTAVVGASGSGKSTLIALLGLLYKPTGGKIIVDGQDLSNFTAHSWQSKIGVVSQSVFLFHDTVMNNIKFANPNVSNEEVILAAEKANAHEFISEMTDGYNTIVGDRGARLSGGQAQRISIARAILVNPQLLILDEATSSLDSYSEKLVQDAIAKIKDECTTLVIAHRLSTIKDADHIIVLHDGRVAEEGKHDELIRKQGYYWNYAKMQDLQTSMT